MASQAVWTIAVVNTRGCALLPAWSILTFDVATRDIPEPWCWGNFAFTAWWVYWYHSCTKCEFVVIWYFWCWNRNILETQGHCCWCPGSLIRSTVLENGVKQHILNSFVLEWYFVYTSSHSYTFPPTDINHHPLHPVLYIHTYMFTRGPSSGRRYLLNHHLIHDIDTELYPCKTVRCYYSSMP